MYLRGGEVVVGFVEGKNFEFVGVNDGPVEGTKIGLVEGVEVGLSVG